MEPSLTSGKKARPTRPPPQRASDLRNLRRLSYYVWDFRGRVIAALGCLVVAKLATVAVPLVLKQIVDRVDASSGKSTAIPLALLAAYGALRLANGAFNELRDALFARVRYRAMQQLSLRVLGHLHSLSLRFHLDRHTGGVARDLERGAQSLSSVL